MGITTNCQEVLKQLDEIKNRVVEETVNVLQKAGEMAVKKARATKTYEDRTGRLTASIGYGVVRDGEVVASGGFEGGEGGAAGMSYLSELAGGSSGLCLIVVAGMEYAQYVTRKGFVVLDGGTLGLGSEIEQMLKEIRV